MPVFEDEDELGRVVELVDECRDDTRDDRGGSAAELAERDIAGGRMDGLEAANDVAPEPNGIGVARVERDPYKRCARPVFARPLREERGLSVPSGRAQKRQSAPATLPQALAQVLPRDECLPRHRDAELCGDDPRRRSLR